jgi:hypothetical protein
MERHLIWFTWTWAVVFLPIETYLTWSHAGTLLHSGYAVNVIGVGITLWGVMSLRGGQSYAVGVLATGWGWTTAVFWRATNLRYSLAADGEPLSFGTIELWLAPFFTMMAAAALVGSLVVLVRGHREAVGSSPAKEGL